MIQQDNAHKNYEKKVTAYIDGSLNAEEISEFEAFILTHPEIELQIKNKKNEIQLLKNMIPAFTPSKDSLESMEAEMKASIFNLLKEEPKGFFDNLRIKWEEWSIR